MDKSRGKPFTRGNTAGRGRPPGSPNKATRISQALFAQNAEQLVQKCIEDALEGDRGAMRLAIERVCPPERDRPVEFPLPPILQLADIPPAMEAILRAVSEGTVTPADAQTLAGMLQQLSSILRDTEIEQRLRALEQPAGTEQETFNNSNKEDAQPDNRARR